MDQPDFNQVASDLHSLAEQVTRCANLPIINEGRRFMEALQVVADGLTLLHQNAQASEARATANSQAVIANAQASLATQMQAMEGRLTARIDALDRKIITA